MKVKLMSVTLFLALALGAPVFAGPFQDVPETHWAYEAIVKMQEKGIIEGFQGMYKGKQPITRYEAAVIIARVIEAVEKAIDKPVGKVTNGDGTVDLTGLVKSGDFDEFKSTVNKLGIEFKDELSALGVRVGNLEGQIGAIQDDINKLKKFQWSGSIRTRIWDSAGSWGDLFKKDRKGGSTGADTYTKLNLNVAVNETTNAKIALYHRNWDCSGLTTDTAYSNRLCQGWTDEGGSKEWLSVNEAYVQTEGMGAKWTVGRQHFQFGPFGVLVKSSYGAYADGAVKAEKDMGGLKLTGLVIPVGDKYVAGRAALPIGEEGDELGVNVIARGQGSITNSFGADLKMSIFKAEIASLNKDESKTSRALGVVVGADVINSEKMTLNIKAASFDNDTTTTNKKVFYPGTMSLMAWEDVEGVFRSGFKGVGVTGTYKVNEDWTLSGEVNKGNNKSPIGFGKVTLGTTLSPNVDASLTLIQVGMKSNSDAMAIRGEMMVSF